MGRDFHPEGAGPAPDNKNPGDGAKLDGDIVVDECLNIMKLSVSDGEKLEILGRYLNDAKESGSAPRYWWLNTGESPSAGQTHDSLDKSRLPPANYRWLGDEEPKTMERQAEDPRPSDWLEKELKRTDTPRTSSWLEAELKRMGPDD